jgi:tRNA pseudouridine55 synthase
MLKKTIQQFNTMPNFLLIDKPSGITSHDVVDRLRRITGERRVGHAGTLDPFATGLLILGIGREATRELGGFLKSDKEYIATLHLGAVSDTYDRTGKIMEVRLPEVFPPPVADLQKILQKFTGEQEQIPPMFSAKKIHGKKMYELARRGIEVPRQPVKIKIYELEILDYTYSSLKIRVRSSSGAYIRSLAHDIGTALGCGAYLEELRRTKIGRYDVKDAYQLEDIIAENWREKCLISNI